MKKKRKINRFIFAQSGKIAEELDFVAHNVRTKLDELKRVELDRLRKLARQKFEQENEIDTKHLKISEPEHLDHVNPHTFEIADLKKLIAKVSLTRKTRSSPNVSRSIYLEQMMWEAKSQANLHFTKVSSLEHGYKMIFVYIPFRYSDPSINQKVSFANLKVQKLLENYKNNLKIAGLNVKLSLKRHLH